MSAAAVGEQQGVTVTSDSDKFWYNLTTGQVERGYASPAVDRAGPFDTEAEAARAPELLRERSKAWAEDDAREGDWGASGAQK